MDKKILFMSTMSGLEQCRYLNEIGEALAAGFRDGFADAEAIDITFEEISDNGIKTIPQKEQGGENMC